MSDTPRTDAVEENWHPCLPQLIWNHARELERENAALRLDKARLDWLSSGHTLYRSRHFSGWDIDDRGYYGDLRKAIDDAMRGNWP